MLRGLHALSRQPSRNSAVLELGGPSALEGVDVAVCGETNGVPEPERCLQLCAQAKPCNALPAPFVRSLPGPPSRSAYRPTGLTQNPSCTLANATAHEVSEKGLHHCHQRHLSKITKQHPNLMPPLPGCHTGKLPIPQPISWLRSPEQTDAGCLYAELILKGADNYLPRPGFDFRFWVPLLELIPKPQLASTEFRKPG